MIEVLVDYIEKKGFRVDVRKNMLIIRASVHTELLNLAWMFAPGEMEQTYKEVLFLQADFKIAEMNKAIVQKLEQDKVS